MQKINNPSIIFSARLVGAIAALALVAAAFMAVSLSVYLDKRNEVHRAVMLYDLLFMTKPSPEDFERYLKQHRLTPVGGEDMQKIREGGIPLIEDPLLRRTFQSGNIEIFIYKDHYYYAYKMHDMYYYRSDEPMTPYMLYILIASGILLLLLVLLYRYISHSIQPLRHLHAQIRRFAEGEQEIDTQVDGTDEVAQVANAFHESVRKVEGLQRSRSLFMRNVMHELKTPIGKGKLLTHLLDIAPKDKALLNDLFEQMQGHLNDLARVESLTARNLALDVRAYPVVDIVDHAVDLLGAKRSQLRLDLDGGIVNVDFNLFAYALKNLIDNALKYGLSVPVDIVYKNICLTVSNTGIPFKEDISTYLQPYRRDTSQHSLEGMGLGLYIVNEIVTRHGYKLEYAFRDRQHFFSILF